MLFNLEFAYNTISSRFFFIFLIIDLYFLVPAVIAEIVISIGVPSKEAKAEIEIHRVIAEAKIRKCLI